MGFTDLSADGVALRSDCVNIWADLELHCPHMTYMWQILSQVSKMPYVDLVAPDQPAHPLSNHRATLSSGTCIQNRGSLT